MSEKRLEKRGQLIARGVSGVVWVAGFLAAAWRGATWYWMVLLVVLAGGVFFELQRLLASGENRVRLFPALLGLLFTLAGAWSLGPAGLGLGAAAALAAALSGVFSIKPPAAGSLSDTLLAALLPGLGFGAAWLLGLGEHGGARLILFLAALWTADTGAYLAGSLLGRHKLVPELSPNKTWEGLTGALVLTPAACWALDRWLLSTNLGLMSALGLGLVIALGSLVGDLSVSALKRRLGVKDTGRVIPGHGGLLDRLDGFLIAAPAALVYLSLLASS